MFMNYNVGISERAWQEIEYQLLFCSGVYYKKLKLHTIFCKGLWLKSRFSCILVYLDPNVVFFLMACYITSVYDDSLPISYNNHLMLSFKQKKTLRLTEDGKNLLKQNTEEQVDYNKDSKLFVNHQHHLTVW